MLTYFSMFDSVISPSLLTINSCVCCLQSTIDGYVVYPTKVWIGLKGISRVMSLYMSPTLEMHTELKSLETIMPFLAFCWTVVCIMYETLPTFIAFFDKPNSFDEVNNLFDTFSMVLRMALSLLLLLLFFKKKP